MRSFHIMHKSHSSNRWNFIFSSGFQDFPLSQVVQAIQEDHLIYSELGAEPKFVSEHTGKLKSVKGCFSILMLLQSEPL